MIRPYKRSPKPLPVGLVGADGTVTDEAGTRYRSLAETPAALVLYADRTEAMARIIGGEGTAVCWNGTPIRWEYAERKVSLLLETPPTPEATLAGLVRFRDWLTSYGARVGSLRSSSKSLLRATITRPLYMGGGEPPPLTEVIGGRRMALVAPGHYSDIAIWDMSAAYARVLGHQTYAGHWVEVPGDTVETDMAVIAHAKIRLPPNMDHPGPLPRRNRKAPTSPTERRLFQRDYPTRGRMQGVWSRQELRLAESLGASVKVDRSWICAGINAHRKPFEPWLAAILEGRELPGYAGHLVKVSGNSMWGSFASYGDRTRLRYSKGGRHTKLERLGFVPDRDAGLAETICATVRVKLYREAVPLGPLSLHTDGGIFPADADFSKLPEGWRYKDAGTSLTYIGPQSYAYGDGDHMSYVVSGVPAAHAAEVFYTMCELVLNYPKRSDPTTAKHLRELRELFDVEPEGA